MATSSVIKGFTLLEILLVVLIVSIMTAVGAQIINSQSIERIILKQAQQFNDNLMFICEKAVLENQAFGIELYVNKYEVMRFQQPEWLLLEPQAFSQINESIEMDLLINGLSQKLQLDISGGNENSPHVICQSDGSFNPFELRFSVADIDRQPSSESYYALKFETPWQLNGAWHQP